MKQIMIDAYKESGVRISTIAGEYPGELHQAMKYPDKVIRAKSQVEIGRALATMAPITHKGEPKGKGAAVAYRLENGRYIVSTANGSMPDKTTMPAIGTMFEEGKLTALYMDIQAASEFASIIAGEKPAVQASGASAPDVDMEDPRNVAADLEKYEEIRGDGSEGEGVENYGMVFGHLNGTASPIPKYLHKYLRVKGDPISIGNGVIRLFDVEVPPDEIEMFEKHKQIREAEMEVEKAKASVNGLIAAYEEEIKEARAEMKRKIEKIEEAMKTDPALQDAQADLDKAEQEREELAQRFNTLKAQIKEEEQEIAA